MSVCVGGGGEQVFLQSEACMRGPESAGVIPTTYQMDMGQTYTHTFVCERSGLSSLLCDLRACEHLLMTQEQAKAQRAMNNVHWHTAHSHTEVHRVNQM